MLFFYNNLTVSQQFLVLCFSEFVEFQENIIVPCGAITTPLRLAQTLKSSLAKLCTRGKRTALLQVSLMVMAQIL